MKTLSARNCLNIQPSNSLWITAVKYIRILYHRLNEYMCQAFLNLVYQSSNFKLIGTYLVFFHNNSFI